MSARSEGAPATIIDGKKPRLEFLIVHAFVLLPMLALVVAVPLAWGWGLSWLDVGLAVGFYFLSGFGITAGFHRYFTHRSFKADRGLRNALAIAGSLALQGDVLTWVADHRRHHAYTDKEGDPNVLSLLGRRAHVIAPDLLGHGDSAKPRSGDYSLGAHAAGRRDLLAILNLERATVVGHSFGGGVALQYAYQYPELTERIVLVASGGLGQGVNLALRAATLPGASTALKVATATTPRWLAAAISRAARAVPVLARADREGLLSAFASFSDGGARSAFVRSARGSLDLSGQRLTGTERLHLLTETPVLLMAGSRDPVIPVDHTVNAHDTLPGSHLELFDGAGHFPHIDDPRRFIHLLHEFVTTTEPAHADRRTLRRHLQETR